MKLFPLLFSASAVALPICLSAQFSISGPGGEFGVDDTGLFNPEPDYFTLPGSSDNLLFRNYLYVQTGDFVHDVYAESNPPLAATSAPAAQRPPKFSTTSNGADTIALSYQLDDLSLDVSYRHSNASDGALGSGLSDYFIMDITLTNRTDERLQVSLANIWDFSLAEDYNDTLSLDLGDDSLLFTQANPNSDLRLNFAGPRDTWTAGDQFDLWWDLLFDGVYPLDNNLPDGTQPMDLAFALGYQLDLEALGSDSLSFAFGGYVIPEPSMAGLLALPLIGCLLAGRRRR